MTYVTFTAGGQTCAGFDVPGPLSVYGYAWRVHGYACRARIDNPEAFVMDVLGALRVGPPEVDKNALGAPVRVFAGS